VRRDQKLPFKKTSNEWPKEDFVLFIGTFARRREIEGHLPREADYERDESLVLGKVVEI